MTLLTTSIGLIVFIAVLMYVVKFTGLDKLLEGLKPLFKILEAGGVLVGANFVYKKARARGFKPPLGKNTKAYTEETEELIKELKASGKDTKKIQEQISNLEKSLKEATAAKEAAEGAKAAKEASEIIKVIPK